jgi:putative MATE family efflux protein
MDEKRKYLLGVENVQKALLLLAIPSIIGMVTNGIYNFVDALFVGMLDNTAMLASVTVAFPMVMLMGAIGQGLGVGAGSLISRQLGKKEFDMVPKSVFTVMFAAIVLSIVGSVLLIRNLAEILPFFGATLDAFEYAIIYTKWMIIGMISTILNMTMSNMLRAEGDVKFPMIAIMSGAILNIVLDPIFMFEWGLNLQLSGAAIATVISHFVTTGLLFIRLLDKKSALRFNPFKWDFNFKIAFEIFAMGIVVFFRQALVSMSFLFINFVAAKYGTDIVASIGIVQRTNGLIIYVLIGYSQGLLPFVGYNYGAQNFERIKQAIKYSTIWASVFTVCAATIMFIFARQLVMMFTMDESVIYYGRRMFYAIAVGLPFVGYYQVVTVLFQAVGKVKESFVLSVARQGFLLLPLVYFLPKVWGYNGLFASTPIADFISLFLAIILANNLQKKLFA